MLTNHDGTIYIREGSDLERKIAHSRWCERVFAPEPVQKPKHELTATIVHPNSIAARLARRHTMNH